MKDYKELIAGDYNFDMNSYMGAGWELFKKGAGSFIGFTLLYFIISFILNLGFSLTGLDMFSLSSSFIDTPLLAGVFIFGRKLLKGHEEFGDFFGGFNYFGQIALHLIVFGLFLAPLFLLLFGFAFPYEMLSSWNVESLAGGGVADEWAARMEENFGMVMGVFFLFFIGAVYLGISYSLTVPLIVDSKMGFWEAMETSRKVVGKKFFGFFGMFFFLGIIMIIGVIITCGLGLLVVIPTYQCIVFSAYDQIFQPNNEDLSDEIESFGTDQPESNTESEGEQA